MKKPYRFDEMSDQVCSERGCNKLIKLNLVERKQNSLHLKCRKHHWMNHPERFERANR